ncbi:MAG: hypothetical protein KGP28_07745 [Bdellovibrionales bacterium]|nr:hypothetical protein [Bdellovibrionales bacterium]
MIWKNHAFDGPAFPKVAGVVTLLIFSIQAQPVSVLEFLHWGLSAGGGKQAETEEEQVDFHVAVSTEMEFWIPWRSFR